MLQSLVGSPSSACSRPSRWRIFSSDQWEENSREFYNGKSTVEKCDDSRRGVVLERKRTHETEARAIFEACYVH
jgi:hypothetical protein